MCKIYLLSNLFRMLFQLLGNSTYPNQNASDNNKVEDDSCSNAESNGGFLTAVQERRLKYMHKSSSFDSTFIGSLLTSVFGNENLKRSSTDGVGHNPLDPLKLEFVKSMSINIYWNR